ncbi:hypothetical protein [Coleofasciculus sp. FACHB-SPT9]|uniref:hypothetical protein n=1 Tax=Cyanophyceae TaxID=3028117 RepID=UPI0030DD55EA
MPSLVTDPSLIPFVKLAFISNDASVVYSPDLGLRLSDLRENPASNYYSKPPEKKVLGDLGEITVFKMLVDTTGEDRLSEQELETIRIKPFLASRINNNDQNPDFYIPSRNLVVDAKAWKKLGSSNLHKVIQKYVNLECLSQGGEVRLYFPSDTYQQYHTPLGKLPTQIGSVRIRAVPMEATYKDLTSQREIILMYLKSLIV